MNISRWLLAAGLLSISGAVAAQDVSDDVVPQESELQTQDTEQGEDVRTTAEQPGQVREEAGDVKEEARELGEEAQEAAGAVGERAAEGAEKAGTGVSQAIREGTRAIQGQRAEQPRGTLGDGDEVRNTLTTDPIGLVIGYGLNAEYSRPLANDKFAVVGGGRFARNRIGDASVTNIGLTAGGDYYIIGQNNEGFRIGPRLELGFGGVSGGGVAQPVPGDDTGSVFGSLAAGGELGYNWVASNGITAGVSAGLRGRLAGRTDTADNYSNASFGPYGKLNLGYSW